MSINFDTSSLQQRIDDMKQDEDLFEKDQASQEKVAKEKHKLKKEMTKAAYAPHHGKSLGDASTNNTAIPTGHAAFILALEEQVNDNLADMASHAFKLGSMSPEMARQQTIYDQITQEQGSLEGTDPTQLNGQAALVKSELLIATSDTDNLSTKASVESHYMTQDAQQNSALTAIGSFLVNNVTNRLGNYSRG